MSIADDRAPVAIPSGKPGATTWSECSPDATASSTLILSKSQSKWQR